ncbi:amidohydrolase [Paenibacillus lycopersici]|uniref:Amidohydrolase n=1 Tax=Paenibacillus lycopersici TaxID=2704462 RepID=A0A6C0FV03_9BACL|nr:amidohydrolase [Paenibacillus lycopersici]QHT59862.1 amidohydrolase [Paenibacillus lycopersici]
MPLNALFAEADKTGEAADFARELEAELIRLRRDFHRHPETMFGVDRTAASVAAQLADYGLEVERGVGRYFGKGVVGTLRGARPGKTILLRADMDALPIREQNDVPYRSATDGVMHACGHDAHMAMLLGAARVLSRCREELAGTVKFAFQPAEEGALPIADGSLVSGGRDMIEAGLLDGVDLCFALHVWPELPLGTVGVHRAYAMAASTHFRVAFQGIAGHHSTPHLAVDALLMAAQFVTEMKVVMASEIDPLEPAVLSFGTLRAGTVLNAIAESSEVTGSYRVFEEETVLRIRDAIERRASAIAGSFGGGSEARFRLGTALKNDARAASLAIAAGRAVFGAERTLTLEKPSLAGEDFALYLKKTPGAFAFLGSGTPACRHPLHHPNFGIDERMLLDGAKLHVRFVLEAMREGGVLEG